MPLRGKQRRLIILKIINFILTIGYTSFFYIVLSFNQSFNLGHTFNVTDFFHKILKVCKIFNIDFEIIQCYFVFSCYMSAFNGTIRFCNCGGYIRQKTLSVYSFNLYARNKKQVFFWLPVYLNYPFIFNRNINVITIATMNYQPSSPGNKTDYIITREWFTTVCKTDKKVFHPLNGYPKT